MNNAQVTGEGGVEDFLEEARMVKLRSEEARVTKILEALKTIQESKEWSSLKTEIFDNLVNVLEKDLRTEAEKDDPSTNRLNRITGELKWARKYSDLSRLENEKRVELQRIRHILYGKSE